MLFSYYIKRKRWQLYCFKSDLTRTDEDDHLDDTRFNAFLFLELQLRYIFFGEARFVQGQPRK